MLIYKSYYFDDIETLLILLSFYDRLFKRFYENMNPTSSDN
jgi:hypothetical protein